MKKAINKFFKHPEIVYFILLTLAIIQEDMFTLFLGVGLWMIHRLGEIAKAVREPRERRITTHIQVDGETKINHDQLIDAIKKATEKGSIY